MFRMYVYIYESKKIRNDTKELLLRDKRKHIILNYRVRGRRGLGDALEHRRGWGELSLE